MQRYFSGLILATLATSILCGETFADDPWDKIGRGKLLRQFRDDLLGRTGNEKPSPTAQQLNSQQQPTPAPTRAGQPAQPRQTQPRMPGQQQPNQYNGRYGAQQQQQLQQQRQQAANTNQGRLPAQAATPTQPRNPNQNYYARPGVTNPRETAQRMVTPPPTANASQAAAPLNPARARNADFGMEIRQAADEKFYIVALDPNGNATKAGVQRGDVISQVGGSPLTTLAELEEIAKILSPGDQLEFELSRSGKTGKVMVQYGTAPALPAAEESSVAPVNRAAPYAAPTDELSLELSNNSAPTAEPIREGHRVAGQYDFVPQPSANGYSSVLDMGGSATARTTPASVRAPNRRGAVGTNLSDTPSQFASHQRASINAMEAEMNQRRTQGAAYSLDSEAYGESILEVRGETGSGRN